MVAYTCGSCGKSIDEEEIAFTTSDGTVYCKDCGKPDDDEK